MKRLARLANDEPISGVDKAVWWTEYVLRNGDAEHLKGSSRKMPLYQYYLVDVFLFLFAVATCFLYVNFILLKMTLRLLLRRLIHNKKDKTE